MKFATKSVRAAALTALVAGTTLLQTASPAQAGVAHKVTYKVNYVQVVDALDANGVGEFQGIDFGPSTLKPVDVIPSVAAVGPWAGGHAYAAGQGAYYPVKTTDLAALVASNKQYESADWSLFGLGQLDATKLNMGQFMAAPGSKAGFSGSLSERDEGDEGTVTPNGGHGEYAAAMRFPLLVPAPGTSAKLKVPFTLNGESGGKVVVYIHVTLSTAQLPIKF